MILNGTGTPLLPIGIGIDLHSASHEICEPGFGASLPR